MAWRGVRRDWSGGRVRRELAARGLTVSAVARAARVAPSTLRRVIDRGRRNPNAERTLARKLGVPVGLIYPSRVCADAFQLVPTSGAALPFEGATVRAAASGSGAFRARGPTRQSWVRYARSGAARANCCGTTPGRAAA